MISASLGKGLPSSSYTVPTTFTVVSINAGSALGTTSVVVSTNFSTQ